MSKPLNLSFPSDSADVTSSVQPDTIELELHDMMQLFDSMDPSPFREKDLDPDAEEFIVG